MSKKKTTLQGGESVRQNGPVGLADPPEAVGASEPPPLPSEPPPLPPEVAAAVPPPPPPPPPLPEPPPIPTAAPSSWEIQLAAAPLAQAAPPSAPLVITAADPALEERLRRLEELLARTQGVTAEKKPEAAPASGPGMLSQAKALFDVGRHLLPALPAGQAPPKAKGWLVWEMVAELRAIFCMYVDPRYRLPWYGYVVPPVLLAAFVFSLYWIPFALALRELKLHWVLTVPVDLLLLYSMFKILGHEARRYRETAPDLPPSLRL